MSDRLDVDSFRKRFEPESIRELLPNELLRTMLRGFLHHVRSGVTLLFATWNSSLSRWIIDSTARIDPFDLQRSEDSAFFNSLCGSFRKTITSDTCARCDQKIAQEYVDGIRVGTDTYECWLGLLDFAYPLTIGGGVRAVLFSGQIVPHSTEQLESIRRKLHEVAPADAPTLVAQLEEEIRRLPQDWNAHAHSRRERLIEFGTLLQSILDRLHTARISSAASDLLQLSGEILAEGNLSAPDDWWQNCAALVTNFSRILNLDDILVFSRRGAYFEQQVPRCDGTTPPRIAAKVIAPALPPNVRLSGDATAQTARLARELGLEPDKISLYMSETCADIHHLSTLTVLHGKASTRHSELVAKFCHAVGLRCEFASLVFEMRQTHTRHVETVADAAHDFRTPLQVVELDLGKALKGPTIDDPSIRKRLGESRRRVFQAREQALSLQRQVTAVREGVNLSDLLDEVIEAMGPLAEAHPCRLVRLGTWPKDARILAHSSQLMRPFMNFIENAIKYSYHGDIYQVRVSLTVLPNAFAKVQISNFGVGIPKDQLDDIKQRGRRALIQDRKIARPGTGLGLAIANKILHEYGGRFEIDSTPHIGGTEEFHRFVTTVDVWLPTV